MDTGRASSGATKGVIISKQKKSGRKMTQKEEEQKRSGGRENELDVALDGDARQW